MYSVRSMCRYPGFLALLYVVMYTAILQVISFTCYPIPAILYLLPYNCYPIPAILSALVLICNSTVLDITQQAMGLTCGYSIAERGWNDNSVDFTKAVSLGLLMNWRRVNLMNLFSSWERECPSQYLLLLKDKDDRAKHVQTKDTSVSTTVGPVIIEFC